MSGFEFTPYGIVPLGTNLAEAAGAGIVGATADVELVLPAQSSVRAAIALQAPAARTELSKLKPIDVVRLAKARLKDVERDIKRLKKLEIERDELKRLLDAAAHKPTRALRSLPTRSA